MALRILYANSHYHPNIGGGAEVMLKAMAEGMAARGHRVSVLTSGDRDAIDTIDGVEVHRVKQRNIYWSFPKEARPVWKRAIWHALDARNPLMRDPIQSVLERVKPDLIVSNNLPGLSIALWRQAKQSHIPVVQVLHDYYLLCPNVTMCKAGQICSSPCSSCRTFRVGHAAQSKHVSAVLAVSAAILKQHTINGVFEGVPIQRVIYNARDLPEPTAHETGSESLTFGFIGGLTPVKGIAALINAFGSVAKAYPKVRLLVAGAGEIWYEEELKRAAQGLPIEFLGSVNAFDFFSKIDICVAPSTWNDPLPGVVYEAISQSVPVIGAALGGIPEMIQPQINGVLFNPVVPGELEKALLDAAAHPEKFAAMRPGARASVAKFTNFARMLDEHESLFQEVVEMAVAESTALSN